jgi:hypothetical protein
MKKHTKADKQTLIRDHNRAAGKEHWIKSEPPEPMQAPWGVIALALGYGIMIAAIICVGLYICYGG